MLFSYSRLDKYQTCPKSFYLKYVVQIPEKPTASLALGKAVHAVIENVVKTQNFSKPYIEILAKSLGEAYGVENPEEIVWLAFRDAVLKEVRQGGTVEEQFELELSPEVRLQGFIDLWRENGSKIELIDWKTNYNTYTPTDTYQLPLYAYYLQEKTGKPVAGRLVFLRTGEVFEQEFTQMELKEAVGWAVATGKEILQKIEQLNEVPEDLLFPASPSHLCEFCGYAGICQGQIENTSEPQSYNEAVKLAEEIIRIEAILKEKKEQLYKYIEGTNIPIPVGEKEFGW